MPATIWPAASVFRFENAPGAVPHGNTWTYPAPVVSVATRETTAVEFGRPVIVVVDPDDGMGPDRVSRMRRSSMSSNDDADRYPCRSTTRWADACTNTHARPVASNRTNASPALVWPAASTLRFEDAPGTAPQDSTWT